MTPDPKRMRELAERLSKWFAPEPQFERDYDDAEAAALLLALAEQMETHVMADVCWTGHPCGTDTLPHDSTCPKLGRCYWALSRVRQANELAAAKDKG